jgi:hypothetical protein
MAGSSRWFVGMVQVGDETNSKAAVVIVGK